MYILLKIVLSALAINRNWDVKIKNSSQTQRDKLGVDYDIVPVAWLRYTLI